MADEQIQEIKSKIDIVDLISGYVPLKKAGKNYKAPCPFHKEKTPSFMVSPELQMFKCFGCFPPGSLVKTERGLRPIETVKIGEKVFTHKGRLREVRLVFKRNYRGDLVKVRLWKMREEVSLTGDHKVLVLRGAPYLHKKYKNLSRRLRNNKKSFGREKFLRKLEKYFSIEEVEAGKLKKEDYLLYPIVEKVRDVNVLDLEKFVNKRLPPHGRKPRKISYKVAVDERFLKLLGYYIAEGSSHRAYIRFSLGPKEEQLVEDIKQILKELFDLDVGVHRRERLGGSGIDMSCCHSFLANIFENICGAGSHNKHIPFDLQFLPLEKQRVLLEAIKRGDGTTFKPSKGEKEFQSITTTSLILKDQMRDILLRLGYFPTVSVKRAQVDKKGVNHRIAYTVAWSDEAASRYNLSIRTRDENLFWVLPIAKLEKGWYAGDVHNLNVDSDHSYVANNFVVGNCGRGGDVYTFLQETEGVEFPEALRMLAERAGVKLERQKPSPQEEKRKQILEVNNLAKEYFSYILEKHPVGERAREYLNNRGIKKETIEAFGLGYAPDSWESLSKFLVGKKYPVSTLLVAGLVRLREQSKSPYDFFRGRIIFPFFGHNQSIIGFAGRTLGKNEPKYVNIGETPVFKKGSFLYGLEQAKTTIKQEKSALVAEGPFDVLSPFQAGTQNIIGSQGTALTLEQIKLLKRYTPNISLCYDTDLAGDAAAKRGIDLAEEQGLNVKVITLPDKYKDPDEMAQKDPVAWKEAVGSAVSVYDFFFSSAFKRHDPKKPLGKKQIADELLPIIKAIPNEIEREHYVQRLASVLETEVGVVRSALEQTGDRVQRTEGGSRKQRTEDRTTKKPQEEKLGLEEYVLSLALHSPLDLAQKTLHKLGKGDFVEETALNLFEELKNHLSGRKRKLEIKVFGGKLKTSEGELLGKVYLWGQAHLEELVEQESELEKEIEGAGKLLKVRGLKRELKTLSLKIKDAELMGDKKTLASMGEQFQKVSQQLAKLS